MKRLSYREFASHMAEHGNDIGGAVWQLGI
jgi:hypothetical protein